MPATMSKGRHNQTPEARHQISLRMKRYWRKKRAETQVDDRGPHVAGLTLSDHPLPAKPKAFRVIMRLPQNNEEIDLTFHNRQSWETFYDLIKDRLDG